MLHDLLRISVSEAVLWPSMARPHTRFCIPLLIDAEHAYDVSVRATPEMEAAGKPPGRNLADKLLNEPGHPQRCCVVLRVEGEQGIENAKGRLVDTLRQREANAQDGEAKTSAKLRLGSALYQRGFHEEALGYLQDAFRDLEFSKGEEDPQTLQALHTLAICLAQMNRLSEAEPFFQRCLEVKARTFGVEHRSTRASMNCLALVLDGYKRHSEAEPIHRRCVEITSKIFGLLVYMCFVVLSFFPRFRTEMLLCVSLVQYVPRDWHRLTVRGPLLAVGRHSHGQDKLNPIRLIQSKMMRPQMLWIQTSLLLARRVLNKDLSMKTRWRRRRIWLCAYVHWGALKKPCLWLAIV